MAGEDFAAAAARARDAVADQWNNPDSTFNQGVDGARDQWNREDSGFNRAWNWLTDGISKQFTRETGDPNNPREFDGWATGAALAMGFIASKFWQANVTGQPPGLFSIQFASLLTLGAVTTAVLGHMGASRGVSNLINGESSGTDYAGFDAAHPEDFEVG